jgi:hypothetical protein
MGTGAYLTLRNSSGAGLTSLVDDAVCMYENGEEGSHLEAFNNLHLDDGQARTEYIEAIGSGDCAAKQSSFTLSLRSEPREFGNVIIAGRVLGKLAVDVGRFPFHTEIKSNGNPRQFQTSVSRDGDQYRIDVEVQKLPTLVAMADSLCWATGGAIEDALTFPPVTDPTGAFTFSAGTFSGLSQATCSDATITGDYGTGVAIDATLTAPELLTHCTVKVNAIDYTIDGGITLVNPVFHATGRLDFGGEANGPQLTGVHLRGGMVAFSFNGSKIPDWVGIELFQAFVVLLDSEPIQSEVVSIANRYLFDRKPSAAKPEKAEVAS